MERKAKIVATLGPASAGEDVIARLFDAGVDVVRLNLSHGSHDDHRRMIRTVR
ncbi:MAG TPA: pyruvate kinase, partial [Thermoanaerobaculia bacterium]